MAPEVKPCVCFLKYIILLYKSVCDATRDAEEAITLCGIYCPIHALSSGTIDNPILDFIIEFLCLAVELITDKPKLRQFIKRLKALCAASEADNAL